MQGTRTKIGEVVVIMRGEIARKSDITANSSYGVTCGELGTTNGAIGTAAKGLMALCKNVSQMRIELDDPAYDVTVTIGDEMIDVLERGERRVFNLLTELYAKSQPTLRPPLSFVAALRDQKK